MFIWVTFRVFHFRGGSTGLLWHHYNFEVSLYFAIGGCLVLIHMASSGRNNQCYHQVISSLSMKNTFDNQDESSVEISLSLLLCF